MIHPEPRSLRRTTISVMVYATGFFVMLIGVVVVFIVVISERGPSALERLFAFVMLFVYAYGIRLCSRWIREEIDRYAWSNLYRMMDEMDASDVK